MVLLSKFFYTAPKGLYHAGVFQKPDNLKVKVIVSQDLIKIYNSDKIIDQVNQRLEFLYKDAVNSITKEDILIFDYDNFCKSMSFDRNCCYF